MLSAGKASYNAYNMKKKKKMTPVPGELNF